MKKLIAIFALLSRLASAECAPEELNRRAIVAHDGTEGIWFPIPVAKCILLDLSSLPYLKRENELVLQRSKLLQDAVTLAKEETKLESEKSFALNAANEVLTKKVISMSPSWFEHPLFLLSVGAAAGIISGVLIVSVAK